MSQKMIAPVFALSVALLPLIGCTDETPLEADTDVQAAAFEIPAPTASKWDQPSIVDIAVGNEDFETLVAAVVAADLVEVLDGLRQFTVFAPTDDAFATLGLDAGNIGDLDKATLTNILLYHVAPGSRPSQSVVTARQLRMMNKDFVKVSGTQLKANNSMASIVATDIKARNGVIHVIDAVLLP
jgi:uncharacterized surface protein with fasciclin (FAS1) repeats